MALTTLNSTDTFNAAIFNSITSIVQQPSGSVAPSAHYYISGNSYQSSGSVIDCYVPFQSTTSVPISVTIDQSDHAASNCAAPAIGIITSGGCQVFASATAIANVNVAGKVTISY